MKIPVTLALAVFIAFAFARSETPAEQLHLTLPPAWFAVPGVPMSLYYDNIVLTEQPESYRFEVTCDIGGSEPRRWTVTPTDRDVGAHAMSITVKNAQGAVVQQGRTVLHVAPRTAGADRSLRLLIVGDSLTAATLYPNDLAKLLRGTGNPKWTMLGTSRPPSAGPGVAHEGYGGWKWIDFLSKFDPKPPEPTPGTAPRKTTSPFVFPDPTGKGRLDIARYFRENCDNQLPDVITFLLGINDCFGANPNDRKLMDAKIDEVLDNAEKLLAEFRKVAPRTVFAIGLTTPPNSRQAAFEANYKDKYTRWGWKRIQHRLVQRMIERFIGRETEGIHVVPTELNLDPINGYPVNNGVHPNAAGYAEIAASFHCWLKNWMAR